ncbi:retrovirus-related pol polyprotein from transposon TNT 1-94 [Tanacetum coccineum]
MGKSLLLYIKGKENGDLLVDSVLNGPFQLGTIEVPGTANTPTTVRARTHADLTEEEKLRASVDIKATNIVLQGLPQDIYNLVNHNDQAKQIWDRVKLLIQEWGKFVIDDKLLKDMHSTNFDHLYSHLRQHEAHANEVRLNRQRYLDPVALVANSSSYLNPTQYYPQMTMQQVYQAPALQQSYQQPTTQQSFHTPDVHQPSPQSFPQLDFRLVVPSFNPTDDPIESLNKAMAFISTAFASPYLDLEPLAFLADNGDTVMQAQASQEIPTPVAFQIDDLDAFDSDCDDAPSAKASYDSHVLSEEAQCSEQPFFNNDTDIDITSDNNIISYEQYLQETKTLVVQSTSTTTQQDELLMSVIDEMQSQVAKCNKVQQENKIVNETLSAELERYKEQVIVDRNAKVADFEKQIHSLKLQLNATVESHKTLSTTVETLKEASKQKEDKYLDEIIDLQKEKKALDNVVYKMGQSTQTMHMLTKPQVFYDECHKMALGYQNPFYLAQAHRKVPALYDGHTIVKKHDALTVTDTEETLELAEESRLKMLAKQNDETVKEKKVNIAPAFLLPISHPVSEKQQVPSEPVFEKEIPRELPSISIVKDSFNKMRNHLNKFEETITFHTKITRNRIGSWGVEHIKGAFEKDVKPFAKTLREYFQMFDQGLHKELNEMKEVFQQMETEVTKCHVDRKCFEIEKKELILESERLLEHIICQDVEFFKTNEWQAKLDAKDLSIAKLREHIANLKGKNKVDSAHNLQNLNAVTSRVYKLDLPPLSPRIKNNREAHVDYLKHSQEHAKILREIVEHARELRPLDSDLDFACKCTTRIQELLVYVSATCPSSQHESQKLVTVTPMNRTRKVRFVESKRIKSYTEASGSKPKSNKRNDRISQPSCSNKTINKVEAQPRIVKPCLKTKNCVSKSVLNANVQDNVLNANSHLVCSSCNECLFDVIHVSCVSDFISDMDAHPKFVKSKKKKHMTRQRSQLINFVSKFLGTIRFENDQIAKIMGYGDYQLGNVTISRVYYVEGLNSADLITGSRDTNLYTISLDDMLKTSPICLLSKASKTKSWLWHRRLSHLNFGTLNQLAKDGLARGILKLKYQKDHLCSACALGKSKKSSHTPKVEDTNQEKLNLLHMDLCGPMRVESINGKKYILIMELNLSTTPFENSMKMSEFLTKHPWLALLNRTALSKDETELL